MTFRHARFCDLQSVGVSAPDRRLISPENQESGAARRLINRQETRRLRTPQYFPTAWWYRGLHRHLKSVPEVDAASFAFRRRVHFPC